jgi:hypothetical protein
MFAQPGQYMPVRSLAPPTLVSAAELPTAHNLMLIVVLPTFVFRNQLQPLCFPVSFGMWLGGHQARPSRGGQENGSFPCREVNPDFPALACHFYDHIYCLGKK